MDIALHHDSILSFPILNILCPKMCALSTPFLYSNSEPFVVVHFLQVDSKKKVAIEKSWFYCGLIALSLFDRRDPSLVQMPLYDTIFAKGKELHLACQLERKCSIPATVLPNPKPIKPKKKRILKRVCAKLLQAPQLFPGKGFY